MGEKRVSARRSRPVRVCVVLGAGTEVGDNKWARQLVVVVKVVLAEQGGAGRRP